MSRAPTPQPGPQAAFLASEADIAIYGGSAGSAKSFALLMYPLKYVGNPLLRAVCFRRSTPELTNPGALWDESSGVYAYLKPNSIGGSKLEHHFPAGGYIKFAHLQYDSTVHDWDSSQVPIIMFDQLEQFSRFQFFYMHSRNRSMSGIPSRIRGACNPDADSWLAVFLAWWIDQDTGLPIPERSGVIRWFVRDGDAIVWADTREELQAAHGADCDPTSCTFIPGTIYDNPILLKQNPAYLARLKGLPRVERERLLGGNWKIRPAAGLMFRREWCPTIEAEPEDVRWVRGWDLAATQKTEMNEPDWTVGVKLGQYRTTKRWVIAADVKRARVAPAKVEAMVLNTAQADGKRVTVRIPQDPGQAGKDQVRRYVGLLSGYTTRAKIATGDKVTRFSPFSAQAEVGNVDLVRGIPDEFLQSLENFPDAKHDDDADAVSEAFGELTGGGAQNIIEYYRQRNAMDAAIEAGKDPSTIPGLPNHKVTRIDLRTQAPAVSRNAKPIKTVGELAAERAQARAAKGLNGKKYSSLSDAMDAEGDE